MKKATKKVTKKAPAKVSKKVTKAVATKTATAKATAKAPAMTKVAAKATKKKAATGVKRKPNAAFMKPLTPSGELAEIVGSRPIPRTEVVKKLWEYIKKHGLQDQKNRRNINADERLKEIFGGKKTVTMFEMAKLVSKHLS